MSVTRRAMLAAGGLGLVAPLARPTTAAAAGSFGTRTVVQTRRSLMSVWQPSRGRPRDTVVLYPSLARLGADFDLLVATLLRDHHRVATVDPLVVDAALPATATIADVVADLVALLDAAAIDVAHVVGHAFGSRVVRLLSTLQPARVASIGCLACGGRIERAPEVTVALLRSFDLALPDAERLASIGTAFFAAGNDPAVWRDGWLPAVGVAEAGATQRTPESAFFLGGPQPMLVVQGTEDATAPPANATVLRDERVARGDATTLVTIPAAGHALLPEQPDAIARAVRRFLRT